MFFLQREFAEIRKSNDRNTSLCKSSRAKLLHQPNAKQVLSYSAAPVAKKEKWFGGLNMEYFIDRHAEGELRQNSPRELCLPRDFQVHFTPIHKTRETPGADAYVTVKITIEHQHQPYRAQIHRQRETKLQSLGWTAPRTSPAPSEPCLSDMEHPKPCSSLFCLSLCPHNPSQQ